MRILHVEDPFSVEERAEKKADIRQYVLPFWCLTLCKTVGDIQGLKPKKAIKIDNTINNLVQESFKAFS